jgi:pSer/pThr/pTyr-binding forkhead associated (FHA) protein
MPSTLIRKLVVARPGQLVQEVRVSDKPVRVGRTQANDIVILGDSMVSREHARFELSADSSQVTLKDLGSSNGTLYNGKKLGPELITLKEGDKIQIGSTIIAYLEESFAPKFTFPGDKPASQSAPWPEQAGEKDRFQYRNDEVVCGRCEKIIPVRGKKPGDRVGCPNCRAIWRIPGTAAQRALEEKAVAAEKEGGRADETKG